VVSFFILGHLSPLLLVNTTIHNSPTCSRKKLHPLYRHGMQLGQPLGILAQHRTRRQETKQGGCASLLQSTIDEL
jgi:hypothetical protein